MTALQIPSPSLLTTATPTSTRSSSPDLPGAWPRTPAHKRSQTCPTLFSPTIPPPAPTSSEPLHLGRVVNFHQRLSLSLSEPANEHDDSSSPFMPVHSCDPISSLPSDASDFTKYNQDSNSSSLVETSFGTCSSSTTPERKHTTTPSSAFSNPRIRLPFDSSPLNPRLSSFLSSSFSSERITPMAFVSPSNKPIPTATSGSLLGQGYPSSAYSTSSGEDYFSLLRTGNEPQSPSISPPSRYLSLSASVSRRVSPSVDELAPPTLPMLMGLSLPGTPNDSIIAESFSSDHFPTSPRATENDAEWTLSLSAMTPTESESMNPTPTSPSLSLSPTSSFRAQLNLDATEHVVDFPSEAASPLASSVAPSPAIPAIDGVSDDPLGDSSLATSAAEYAAAVMSSAWSFDDPPLPPIGIEMPHHDRDSMQDQLDLDSSQGHHGPDVQLEEHTQRKKGLMTKVKKIGGRLGRLLKIRKEVAEMRRPQSAPAIRTTTLVHTSARPSPRLPSLNIDLEESVLPLPSPLRSSTETNRLRRPRPRSRGHPFVTASRPHSINLPEIQVLPPSVQNSPETSAPKSDMPTPAPQKNLAEIKANRRFSLSAITNLGRPASPPPTPPPILVASRRRRPVSARLALPTSPRRRESLHFEEDVPRPVSRSSRLDPPGLGLAFLGVPGTSDAVSQESSTAHSDTKSKDLKKGRRFSFSALSSLASGGGLREDGSSGWAGSSRL